MANFNTNNLFSYANVMVNGEEDPTKPKTGGNWDDAVEKMQKVAPTQQGMNQTGSNPSGNGPLFSSSAITKNTNFDNTYKGYFSNKAKQFSLEGSPISDKGYGLNFSKKAQFGNDFQFGKKPEFQFGNDFQSIEGGVSNKQETLPVKPANTNKLAAADAVGGTVKTGIEAVGKVAAENALNGDSSKDDVWDKKDEKRHAKSLAINVGTSVGGTLLAAIATGAIAGGVGGAITGPGAIITATFGALFAGGKYLFNKNKDKKATKERRKVNVRTAGEKANLAARREIAKRQEALAVQPSDIQKDYVDQFGYLDNIIRKKRGGVLWDVDTLAKNIRNIESLSAIVPVKKFQQGGILTPEPTNNIIPNGVLHEEENNLGDKGMPVVVCKSKDSCEKKYEIEKDELILTKDTTTKIEELTKNKEYKKLGSFLKEELLGNTYSFTDRYKDILKN